MNRLTQKSYAGGTQAAFTYDTKENILTASNPHITYAYAYDASNRITGVNDSNGHSVAYQYDSLGNRTQMTGSDGRTTTYTYDGGNRLAQIGSGTERFGFGYDTSGRRTWLTYPNGVATAYSYDPGGRLTHLIHTAASGEIESIAYSHDGVGNRLSRTTLDDKNLYTYDRLYRLVQSLPIMLQGRGKELPKKAVNYTYDPAGNRLTADQPKTYAYDARNRLTGTNQAAYSYDHNGNLASKVEGETTYTYVYDYENRLTRVIRDENGTTVTVEYKYDPFGRRIEKRVTEDSATTVKRYFYDNEDILFEYGESGAIGNRYTHGPGIDETLSVTTDSGTYYYHADGLGTITALTDSDQGVVQEYEYDAFGNLHDEKNAIKQPYTYTGREWDKEAKLYYYRARYYDAEVGRFVSKDPFPGVLTDSQTLNRYPYVQNNPVNKIDPSGLIAIPAGIAVCMANPACASALLAGGVVTAEAFSKWIETIEVPSEPMPTRDLSNIPERCRIEYEVCKGAADQAECGEVMRATKKAWCLTKFLICLAGTGP